MAFSDWLLIGGAALLLRVIYKKEAGDRMESEVCYDESPSKKEKREVAFDRRREVNNKRIKTPCCFIDGLSLEDFTIIANRTMKRIVRVKSMSINGAMVFCNVESQTGYSSWNFCVDFNNWGHVTGRYWINTENYDSSIPKHFGRIMSIEINRLYTEKNIRLNDFAYFVDLNSNLETISGLNSCYKKKLWQKVFSKRENLITIKHNSDDLLGQHLYPVISILKSEGLKNLRAIPIKDIDDRNIKFVFEVEQVVIAGVGFFEIGNQFPDDSNTIITYHDKKEIRMPFSQSGLKGKTFIEVCEQLRNLGFAHVYKSPIKDLVTGWIVKDGAVEKIYVDGEDGVPIRRNRVYLYDTKLVIYYHTFKHSARI